MSTKHERSSRAIKGMTLTLVLGLWAGSIPSLAAQTLEDNIDSLARQVTQLNEVILELRS